MGFQTQENPVLAEGPPLRLWIRVEGEMGVSPAVVGRPFQQGPVQNTSLDFSLRLDPQLRCTTASSGKHGKFVFYFYFY